MPAYKTSLYGWLFFTCAAICIGRPLYAIGPTVYMPILSLILRRRVGRLRYRQIHSIYPAFGGKLSIANLIFCIANGALLAQIDKHFYT